MSNRLACGAMRSWWRGYVLTALTVWSVIFFASLGAPATATGEDAAAELTIGSAQGEVGDAVEVPVTLTTNGTEPSTVVFSISYDLACLEYVSVAAGPAAEAAGKDVSFYEPEREGSEAGKVNLIVWGVNQNAMGDGVIVTVQFKILRAGGGAVALTGSNASGAKPEPDAMNGGSEQDVAIDVVIFDGQVLVDCIGPAAPTGVTASQGRTDGVLVSWSTVAGATEYCVYCGVTDNPSEAQPLGDGWLAGELSYLDTTAEPFTGAFAGCSAGLSGRYYYWVKARDQWGCESDFSECARGYRGPAKSGVYQAVLPAKSLAETVQLARTDSTLCIRLRSADPIDPESVWGRVVSSDGETGLVYWAPGGEGRAGDGWVVCVPEAPWQLGDLIVMTAGAATISGEPLEPVTYEFSVELDGAKQDGFVTVVESDLIPALDAGVGAVYEIGPEEVYDTPQWVWLPVPAGVEAADLALYYYHTPGGDSGWYAAEDVEGWLVPESLEVIERDGATEFGFLVRHSGIVQLGWSQVGTTPVTASMGDVLMIACTVVTLVGVARARYCRRVR